MSLPSAVAGAGIWLHQESIRHILASPGTIAVNVTWIEREFNACQTPCSMYPSIFNHFPVIKAVSLKVCHFNTFFAHFGLCWVRPWDNRGKCYMDGKRIQCIAGQRAIARYWSEIATFSTPLHLTPPLGVFPLEFREKVWTSEN